MAFDPWNLSLAFVLVFIGLIAVTAGVRGQAANAGKLLQGEFTGSNSFIQWFLAIMILGMIGFYKPVKPVADAMLGLVIVAMVLAKGNPNNPGGGVFKAIETAFQSAKATPPATSGAGDLLAPVGAGTPGLNLQNPLADPTNGNPFAGMGSPGFDISPGSGLPGLSTNPFAGLPFVGSSTYDPFASSTIH